MTDEAPAAPPARTTPAGGWPLLQGEVKALAKRSINEETCGLFRYLVGMRGATPVQIAQYTDETGSVVAQKWRDPTKKFGWTGEPKGVGLFGQHRCRDGGRQLVITEGEIDAMSVSQILGHKWPVVSVRNGAAGAAKCVAEHIEWLEKFDTVVFLFDNDQPGRDAAQECAALLTPGKAKIGTVAGHKDANAALQVAAGNLVVDAVWGAKEYRPDGIVGVDDVIEEACADVVHGIPWPWQPLTDATYGIRRKELYGFGGGTGIGKTDTFMEIAVHLMSLGLPIGGVYLEQSPAHSLRLLTGKTIGKRLHVPGHGLTSDAVRAEMQKLSGKVRFYDHWGAQGWEAIKSKIRYMVLSLGIKDIFLDHLTALAASMDGEDERKQIDKLMAELASMAQQLDFTLYYISHLTTPEGKPHEEGGRVLEKHFRGSRAIAYWSHFLFGIERDKQNPTEPTTFRVLKDRYTGDAAGLTFGLRYDRATGRNHVCDLPTEGEKSGFKNEEQSEF